MPSAPCTRGEANALQPYCDNTLNPSADACRTTARPSDLFERSSGVEGVAGTRVLGTDPLVHSSGALALCRVLPGPHSGIRLLVPGNFSSLTPNPTLFDTVESDHRATDGHYQQTLASPVDSACGGECTPAAQARTTSYLSVKSVSSVSECLGRTSSRQPHPPSPLINMNTLTCPSRDRINGAGS